MDESDWVTNPHHFFCTPLLNKYYQWWKVTRYIYSVLSYLYFSLVFPFYVTFLLLHNNSDGTIVLTTTYGIFYTTIQYVAYLNILATLQMQILNRKCKQLINDVLLWINLQ